MIKIQTIYIPQLHRKRKLRIYLPKDYKKSGKRYPVLYMHDGQNLYDGTLSISNVGWEAQKVVESYGEEIIIVGIDHGNQHRFSEYSPWNAEITDPITERAAGYGAKYADFLVNTLKPFIDANYPTLSSPEHTALCGSSMGGVISLYTSFTYPGIFGAVAPLSVASWTARNSMMTFLKNAPLMSQTKMYISVGTNEGHNPHIPDLADQYHDDYLKIVKILETKQLNLQCKVFEGNQHCESDWRQPLFQFIQFWRG